MAYREIIPQLIRQADGNWRHASGLSVKDYIKTFADNSENSFLFKTKPSSGSGSSGNQTQSAASSDTNTSLFAKTQDEVLQMAREGKLPRRK
jgi:hypothetical protein